MCTREKIKQELTTAETLELKIEREITTKVALYTIVPRSPFFSFCTPKYCGFKNDIKCG